MPHQPNTSLSVQGKPTVLYGAPSGSQIILRQIGSFTVTTLANLSDVDVSSPTEGDALIFNSSTGKYETGPIDGGTWGP